MTWSRLHSISSPGGAAFISLGRKPGVDVEIEHPSPVGAKDSAPESAAPAGLRDTRSHRSPGSRPGLWTAVPAGLHRKATVLIAFALITTLALGIAFAQRRPRRDIQVDRNGVPTWEVDPEMPDDLFTFVRVRYNSFRRGGAWATDWPDADLNLSYRLQQLTSLRSHPDGKILDIDDPALFDYPFLYLIEPGDIYLSSQEAATLRRYLLSGGFLMIDDFWGDYEWENFHSAFKEIFPDRELEELPVEHPIFHCVYDLKEKPQVPSIGAAHAGRSQGITYERSDAQTPHYKACFDDQGRMMMIVCHNTDLGDGWEREGEDEWYFREFSEKKSYPLGINILFYQFTH